jgi:SAM-dependent methyltransferase
MDISPFVTWLRCPSCNSNISHHQHMYHCESLACRNRDGFLSVHGQPILIDRDSSVISPDDLSRSQGSSPIRRRLPGALDRALTVLRLNTADATRKNAGTFLSQLPPASRRKPRVLVIGGGARGVGTEQLYSAASIELLSFDIYATADTQFIADAHRIPLKDGSVDGVWIQAVLEHVVEPQIVVSEIHRILATDGVLYSEIPFLQHVHEGAYDFTRFTLSGHRYLLKAFSVLDSGPHGGAGTQLNWAIDHFIRSLFRSRHIGKVAKLMSIWLVWLDRVATRAHSIDAASGTFLLARKSDQQISHREIIAFYTGAG